MNNDLQYMGFGADESTRAIYTGSLMSGAAVHQFVRWAAASVLMACLAVFAVMTWQWPLVGDASLMHYVAFLTDHGLRPYREIAEYNMPGAFLVDEAVIHGLGAGSVAWRVFDLMLIGVGIGAMVAISWPEDWFAGVFAGVLLGLIHGRDGIFDSGQRDFVVAVLLVVGYAALFRATRRLAPRWMVLFGLSAGPAATIKPTYILMGLLLPALAIALRKKGVRLRAFVLYGVVGFLAPLAGVSIWLWKVHALSDLVRVSLGPGLYHAGLGRRPLGYLVVHSVAPLLVLVGLWVVLAAFEGKGWWGWERGALAIGLAVGLFSILAQGKGYPYHRYPLIALLLVLMGMDFSRAVRKPGAGRGLVRVLGWAGIAYGVLVLAPLSARAASRYDWRNMEFQDALVGDLNRLGGEKLSGQVQCVDTVGGCLGALYELKLVESTGFLYDEFLFGPERNGVVARSRAEFWDSLKAHPPKVIIVVSGLFPTGASGFQKLELWPEFNELLRHDYFLFDQVTPPDPVYWWSRSENPHSYRIYCRQP